MHYLLRTCFLPLNPSTRGVQSLSPLTIHLQAAPIYTYSLVPPTEALLSTPNLVLAVWLDGPQLMLHVVVYYSLAQCSVPAQAADVVSRWPRAGAMLVLDGASFIRTSSQYGCLQLVGSTRESRPAASGCPTASFM